MSGDQRVRRPGDGAVLVAIKRPSRERRRAVGRRAWGRMSRAQWIVAGPLVAVVLFFVVALTVYPPLYVLFGTGVPGLVDEAGEKGPVPAGDKFKALGIWIPWTLVLGFGVWAFVRQRVMRPYLALDVDGVWAVFGGRIRDGLGWEEIAAIHVVGENEPTTVPAAPPFVEIFPTKAIDDSGSATPLAAMVVTAQPPAPRLRGKRYVIELDVSTDELGRAIERFGAGKRLVLG
ncbi:hypothetical protein [Actinomadura sp. B10D3]|uniref:hypothetical protein n=1 Tax=Actinomadura sp. B10D3 TaxID=3153557 RepID=UPI00325E1727